MPVNAPNKPGRKEESPCGQQEKFKACCFNKKRGPYIFTGEGTIYEMVEASRIMITSSCLAIRNRYHLVLTVAENATLRFCGLKTKVLITSGRGI